MRLRATRLGAIALAARRGGGAAAYNPIHIFGSDLATWYGNSVDDLWRAQAAGGAVTLYQDNLGTTPITALEQTVGLILDKSKGLELGPEIATNGQFDNATGWGLDTGWSISGGRAVFVQPGTGNRNIFSQLGPTCIAGRAYLVEFDIVAGSGFRAFVGNTQGPVGGAAGSRYRAIITATVTGNFLINGGSATNGEVDNLSVRELPGHHLSQPTATSRGRLSARYSLVTNTVWDAVTPTGWTDFGTGATREVITMSNGQPGIRFTGTNNRPRLSQALSPVPPAGSVIRLRLWIDHAVSIDFPLRKLAQILQAGSTNKFSAIRQENFTGPGWYETTLTVDPGTTAISIQVGVGIDGNAVDLVEAGLPDCRLTAYPASWPQYQRVTTASDYDTVGFPARLVMDGVDDSWLTGTVDLTTASALTVTSVFRHTATSEGWVFNINSNNDPSIWLRAPTNRRMATHVRMASAEFSTPNPLEGAVDRATVVVNYVDAVSGIVGIRDTGVANETTRAISGTMGNDPLHVGQRSIGSSRFSGDIFSLPMIVRRLATPEEITDAESAFGRTIGVLQ